MKNDTVKIVKIYLKSHKKWSFECSDAASTAILDQYKNAAVAVLSISNIPTKNGRMLSICVNKDCIEHVDVI